MAQLNAEEAARKEASLPFELNPLMLLTGLITCLLPQDKQIRALEPVHRELMKELLSFEKLSNTKPISWQPLRG
jgi:hypothetical protein